MLLRKRNRAFWILDVDKHIAKTDYADRDSEKARYLSTQEFLMVEYEMIEELDQITKKGAIDLWLRWIVIFLNVDKSSKFMTKIPATSGRFLLARFRCEDRTGHNDMQCRPRASPRNFVTANGPEEGKR